MNDEATSYCDQQKRVGTVFPGEWSFMKGVVALAHLPPVAGVEIAFAGRSNVGKSSLLNALVARKGLARASNTPGRTQEINYFQAKHHPLRLVDMPGYGYASAPRNKVSAWQSLVREFLQGRPNLRRCYMLVDARHGLKRNDLEMMQLLDKSAVSYQVVLTKSDKIKAKALEALLRATAQKLEKRPACHPQILATSSRKQRGIDTLRQQICAFL